MGLHGLLDVVRRLWETAKANHTFYLCPYENSSIGISWTRSKNEMRMPDMSLRLHDLRYQPLENAYAALLLRLCDAAIISATEAFSCDRARIMGPVATGIFRGGGILMVFGPPSRFRRGTPCPRGGRRGYDREHGGSLRDARRRQEYEPC